MVDAEDADVIVISAYISTILQKRLIWYREKQKIKCHYLYPNEVVNVLIGFYALTGVDAASGFYRQSKENSVHCFIMLEEKNI